MHLTTPAKVPIILSQDDYDDICNMYEAKIPARDIVAKYGIHRTTLPKIYKRMRGISGSLIPQMRNPDYFQVIDSHEKAYFLGFIAADGCIVDNSARNATDRLMINIHKKDRVVIERLHEVLALDHKVYEIPSKDQVALAVTHKGICDDLRQYGLDYRKSLMMPNIWPLIPGEFRDSFALGYIDGDGCILIKSYTYVAKKGDVRKYSFPGFSIAGTLEFLKGFADNFQVKDAKIRLKNSIHELAIDKRSDFWKVYDRIYANADKTVHLERKRNVINRLNQDQTISSPAIAT